jgi:hypothetical protein
MTQKFPKDYKKPVLHAVGEKVLEGWAACPTLGDSYCIDTVGTGPGGNKMTLSPEVLGEGL